MLFLQTKLDLLSIFFSMSIGKFPLTFAILGVSDSFSGSSHHHQSHKAMEDCHISQSIPRYLFEPATLHEQNPANQLGIFTHTHIYVYIYIYTYFFPYQHELLPCIFWKIDPFGVFVRWELAEANLLKPALARGELRCIGDLEFNDENIGEK